MKTVGSLAKSKPFIAFATATLIGGTVGLAQLATAANSDVPIEPAPVATFNLDEPVSTGAISPDLTYNASITPSEQPSSGSGTTSQVSFQFSNTGASALTITRFEFRYAQSSPFSYQVGSAQLDASPISDPTITIPPEVENPVSAEWTSPWTVPAQDVTPGILVLTFNVSVAAQDGGPYTISFYADENGDTLGPVNVSVSMIAAPTVVGVSAEGSRGQVLTAAPNATAAPGHSIDQSLTCLFEEGSPETCQSSLNLGASVGSMSYDVDNNLFTFLPFENFVGVAQAKYRVTDSAGQKGNATIAFTSKAPPTVSGITNTTSVNVAVELTPDVTPAEGLTIDTSLTCVRATVDGACGTTAAVGTAGTLSYSNVSGKITFTPAVGFKGIADGFYSATDSLGGTSTGTVTVNVVDGTTAGNVSLSVPNNGSGSVDPVVTPAPGATITATCVKATVDAEVCGATASVSGGTFGYDSETNKLTFTSNGSAVTNPVVGFYQVTDSNAAAAVGQISVTVVPNPTAAAVTLATGVGNPVTSTLTGTPAEGQTINVAQTCIQDTATGTCGSSVAAALGNFSVTDSALTFTPANSTSTGTATAFYRVKDGLGGQSSAAQITVTIVGKPTAGNLSEATTKGTGQVLLTPNGAAATGATLDNTKTCLRATVSGTCGATVTTAGGVFEYIAGTNKIKFVPGATFTGTAQAFYRVEDNLGSTETAQVNVTVANFTPTPTSEVVATPGTPAQVADIVTLAGTGYNTNTVAVSVDNGVTWSATTVADATKGTWTVTAGKVSFSANQSYTGLASALARIQGSTPAAAAGKVKTAASTNEFKVFNLSVNVAAAPAGAPGKPTAVAATAGNASALVSWTAPTNSGASAITGYTVTSNPGSKTCTTTGVTTCRVEGLTNGQAYTFTVVATNASGNSDPSDASAAVTPSASAVTVPDAPTAVTAVAGDGKATITWTAPAGTGGAAITGYTVTSTPGSKTCTTTGSLTCVVEGLTNGTAYTFTVVASNSAGNSLPSVASASVTPAAEPGPGPGPTPGPTVTPIPVPDGGGGGGVVVPVGNDTLPKTGSDILAPTVLGLMFVIAGVGLLAMQQRRRFTLRTR